MVCICLAQGVALLGGMALLELVCHCGCGLMALILAAWKSVFHWLTSDEDVDLSALPVPCLPRCCHASTLMITHWTSEPVSQLQLNVVLIRVALVMVSVHSSKTLLRYHLKIEFIFQTTLRFPLTPVRVAKIKNSDDSRCWQGCGGRGTLFHCW